MDGEKPQAATTSDDIKLDFSGLFAETNEANQARQKPEQTTKPTAATGGSSIFSLVKDAEKAERDHQKSLEICQTYQRNIRETELLTADILKEIRAGADAYTLFLKAAKVIALTTNDSLFYTQAEADIKAIHGHGLGQKPPLQRELEEVTARLHRMIEAEQRETDSDTRQRIASAIRYHRERIEALAAEINKAA